MRSATFIVVFALIVGVAQADTLYAVSGSFGQSSTLYTLDKADGSVLSTVGATGFSHVTGIAVHPDTGVLYGVVSDFYGSGYTQLISIDTTTGAGTALGATGHQIPDIAFGPDGTLYGWSQLPGGPFPAGLDGLVKIDLGSGQASVFGTPEFYTAVVGLGIDSAGIGWQKGSQFGGYDTLYSVDLATGQLVQPFDPSGLGARFLDAPTIGPVFHNMLAFDENDMLFSGARFGPQGSGGFTLFSIDLGLAHPGVPGATTTTIGSNSLPYISGIAFAPAAVPLPGSLPLLAAGLVAFGVIRARRRRLLSR